MQHGTIIVHQTDRDLPSRSAAIRLDIHHAATGTGFITLTQIAHGHTLPVIEIALGEMQQQIADAVHAAFAQARGNRRPDAVQNADILLQSAIHRTSLKHSSGTDKYPYML